MWLLPLLANFCVLHSKDRFLIEPLEICSLKHSLSCCRMQTCDCFWWTADTSDVAVSNAMWQVPNLDLVVVASRLLSSFCLRGFSGVIGLFEGTPQIVVKGFSNRLMPNCVAIAGFVHGFECIGVAAEACLCFCIWLEAFHTFVFNKCRYMIVVPSCVPKSMFHINSMWPNLPIQYAFAHRSWIVFIFWPQFASSIVTESSATYTTLRFCMECLTRNIGSCHSCMLMMAGQSGESCCSSYDYTGRYQCY
jgi:hypothetical protein